MWAACRFQGLRRDSEGITQIGGIVLIRAAKGKNSQFIVSIEREESVGPSAVDRGRSFKKLAIGKPDAVQDLPNPGLVKGETGVELAVSQPCHLHAKRCFRLRAAVGKKHRMFGGIVQV